MMLTCSGKGPPVEGRERGRLRFQMVRTTAQSSTRAEQEDRLTVNECQQVSPQEDE